MISDFFIRLLLSLIGFLLQVLPDAPPIPAAALDWIGYFHNGLQMIGWALPIDQIFIIFGLYITIQGYILVFSLGERVYKWFRG